jgi:hypothetical protein
MELNISMRSALLHPTLVKGTVAATGTGVIIGLVLTHSWPIASNNFGLFGALSLIIAIFGALMVLEHYLHRYEQRRSAPMPFLSPSLIISGIHTALHTLLIGLALRDPITLVPVLAITLVCESRLVAQYLGQEQNRRRTFVIMHAVLALAGLLIGLATGSSFHEPGILAAATVSALAWIIAHELVPMVRASIVVQHRPRTISILCIALIAGFTGGYLSHEALGSHDHTCCPHEHHDH